MVIPKIDGLPVRGKALQDPCDHPIYLRHHDGYVVLKNQAPICCGMRGDSFQSVPVRHRTSNGTLCKMVVKVHQQVLRIVYDSVYAEILCTPGMLQHRELHHLLQGRVVEANIPAVHRLDALQTLPQAGIRCGEQQFQALHAVLPPSQVDKERAPLTELRALPFLKITANRNIASSSGSTGRGGNDSFRAAPSLSFLMYGFTSKLHAQGC
mmetsp:Transcript_124581/g.265699  ORF Transcript_124581/g.265699 Transcript_124581/m.265699 type:complete len:210 (+) Transcript_124581:645-1274(+)